MILTENGANINEIAANFVNKFNVDFTYNPQITDFVVKVKPLSLSLLFRLLSLSIIIYLLLINLYNIACITFFLKLKTKYLVFLVKRNTFVGSTDYLKIEHAGKKELF